MTTRFDGGVTYDVASTSPRASSPRTRRAKATGRSAGYASTFDRGNVAFVMTIAGEVEPPVLIDVSADPPHVKFAQPD